jgi:hypothetical protein
MKQWVVHYEPASVPLQSTLDSTTPRGSVLALMSRRAAATTSIHACGNRGYIHPDLDKIETAQLLRRDVTNTLRESRCIYSLAYPGHDREE